MCPFYLFFGLIIKFVYGLWLEFDACVVESLFIGTNIRCRKSLVNCSIFKRVALYLSKFLVVHFHKFSFVVWINKRPPFWGKSKCCVQRFWREKLLGGLNCHRMWSLNVWYIYVLLTANYQNSSRESQFLKALQQVACPSIFDAADKFLSLVIPAYNEEDRLPGALDETMEWVILTVQCI